MARKPGRMYRNLTQRSYTRREYMGGVPGSKIVSFDMGEPKMNFPIKLTMLAKEACQIRHSALEAGRTAANRVLLNVAGRTNYHMKVHVYPHEVLRENKQATGAGADRVSQGMRRAFGKAVGTAARVSPGQRLFSVSVNKEQFTIAKDALKRASHKLPTPVSIVVTKGAELVRNL